ncbi:MAG: hypothetical protein M1150_01040 [Patescibacteria group bacterium]|nr:hypothetical protein [Patescibacteria group bacterium]
MLTIIHGNNLLASRKYLLDLKSKFEGEVETVNGRDLTLKALEEILSRSPLFSEKKILIIEYFPKELILKKVIDVSSNKIDVIIWVDKRVETKLPKAKILEFKELTEENTFKLAELVGFKNQKLALKLLEKLLSEKSPPEFIVASLERELRLLMAAKEDALTGSKVHPFVIKKMKERAKSWEVEEIKKALEDLVVLDLNLKTRKTDFRMSFTTWLFNI